MLSISRAKKGSDATKYYLALSRDDYYTKGGEPPGKWHGEGARKLGLTGEVSAEGFTRLAEGFSPQGEQLVQNAGKDDRAAFWDLTFSAPKSVSVLWSQAPEEVRGVIEKVHEAAVKKALDYLEEEAGLTRRGKGGEEIERAELLFATFEHGTSRAQDPQLHTHAVLLNVGVREDGSTGSLMSRAFFQEKMTAGAVYRAELSKGLLEELGVRQEKERNWFEVSGVSKELREEYSKRRSQIEELIEKWGDGSARASAEATLRTRPYKGVVKDRETLFDAWRADGKAFGFSHEAVRELLGKETVLSREGQVARMEKATEEAILEVSRNQSVFSSRDVRRVALEKIQGEGIGADVALDGVRKGLEREEVVRLGKEKGLARFTTRETLEVEGEFLSRAERLRDKSSHIAKESSFEAAKKSRTLSSEQEKALYHITREAGSIKAVRGLAGTGKSYLLGAAREVWEREGFSVIGAALAGKAAEGLSESSEIQSNTIHSTLYRLQKGYLTLTDKTVLVVDEAGMVDTRRLEALSKHVEKAGAKLVITGDWKQLQSIEAGGAFRAFLEQEGGVSLENIIRQKEEWARVAVRSFEEGRARDALQEYASRGQVSVEEDVREAKRRLIDEWKGEGVKNPDKHLILAGQNIDVRELNQMAQHERKRSGELREESTTVGNVRVYEGDRVVFTKRHKLLGIQNGSFGEVKEIDKKNGEVTFRLDNKREVRVNAYEFSDLKLGYAATTHKAQGMTVDNSYVLLGGGMQDRELTYVQASRAKGETRFYLSKIDAGEGLSAICRKIENSRAEELAISILGREGRKREQEIERA